MSKRLVILAFAALAACGTPQEQCIARNTRDLRTVDRLIAETEGNLQRGYALETVTRWEEYWDTCFDTVEINGRVSMRPYTCEREYSYTEQRPKAIDLNAEAEKLESLKVKRTELSRIAGPLIEQCKVEFPE